MDETRQHAVLNRFFSWKNLSPQSTFLFLFSSNRYRYAFLLYLFPSLLSLRQVLMAVYWPFSRSVGLPVHLVPFLLLWNMITGLSGVDHVGGVHFDSTCLILSPVLNFSISPPGGGEGISPQPWGIVFEEDFVHPVWNNIWLFVLFWLIKLAFSLSESSMISISQSLWISLSATLAIIVGF